MICSNCKSGAVQEKIIEGLSVDECQRCGHLHGKPDIIQKISEIREARDLGIDPLIYPLQKTIQAISSFKIEYACAGYPQEKVPPYISFYVTDGGYRHLEKLAESLLYANKKTAIHWIIEASFQKKLIYILKPNFHHDPYHISAEQISSAQKDIEIINTHLLESFKR